jgi:hypothetical protein
MSACGYRASNPWKPPAQTWSSPGRKAFTVTWQLPEPILSTPAAEPYLRPGWAAEPKWDGFWSLV